MRLTIAGLRLSANGRDWSERAGCFDLSSGLFRRLSVAGKLMERVRIARRAAAQHGCLLARYRFRTGGGTRFWLTLLQCLQPAIACKQCQLIIDFATKLLACHAGAVTKSGALGTPSCGCVTEQRSPLSRRPIEFEHIEPHTGRVPVRGSFGRGFCDASCDGSECGIG